MTTALRLLFAAFLCATGVVSGCNGGVPAVRGSGVVASETRDVAGFTEVRVSGAGDVVIDQTGTESLTVEAEDNILPLLDTRVSNGVLHLGLKQHVSVRTTRPIRFHITVKDLTGVGISGSGSVHARGLDADTLAAEISGSGSAALAGRADAVTLRVSGSGSYDAADLQSKSVKVEISGSGDALVNASDRLDATISGSGSVRYAGNPSVSQRVSGSGSIARR
jgi:hypothetical protein